MLANKRRKLCIFIGKNRIALFRVFNQNDISYAYTIYQHTKTHICIKQAFCALHLTKYDILVPRERLAPLTTLVKHPEHSMFTYDAFASLTGKIG